MKIAGRFTTSMEAMHAAAFLRAGGVKAVQMFDQSDPFGGFLGVDLGIADDDVELAERLLREYHASDPGASDSPEDPDLSVLDPALAPRCPACGTTLPLELIDHCPHCHAEVDVPELIAETHGPEALANCYGPTTSVSIPDPESYTLCPTCGYDLDGIDVDTRCPECGEPRHNVPPLR